MDAMDATNWIALAIVSVFTVFLWMWLGYTALKAEIESLKRQIGHEAEMLEGRLKHEAEMLRRSISHGDEMLERRVDTLSQRLNDRR